MTLTKRRFLNLTAASALSLALPLASQAADIKAMAESLVNLTIKAPDGETFTFKLSKDVLKKAAGHAPEKRAALYASHFETVMKSKMRDIPDGTSNTLSGRIAKVLGGACCDRLEEGAVHFKGSDLSGTLSVRSNEK